MTTFWCVNFDTEPVLKHGLAEDLWLMQYQYSHDGYDFQGSARQIAATSKNWNVLCGIQSGDWFVAYLPNNMFYGIGEVIKRRIRARHSGADVHVDTVQRTVQEHRHRFLDGIVEYSDTATLYEDFTDTWTCPFTPPTVPNQPKMWQYSQRIDVREWDHVTPQGVCVDGLSSAAAFPTYRQAAFEIKGAFFEMVAAELRDAIQSRVSPTRSIDTLARTFRTSVLPDGLTSLEVCQQDGTWRKQTYGPPNDTRLVEVQCKKLLKQGFRRIKG